MLRRAPHVLALALLAALPAWAGPRAPAGLPGANDDTYTNAKLGFTIKRPGAGWAFSPKSDASGYRLTLGPSAQGGSVAVTIRVKTVEPGTAAKTVRDQVLKTVEGQTQYSRKKLEQAALLGKRAPAFSLDMASGGGTYRVWQAYVVREDQAFTVACHAPVKDFQKWWPTFQHVWKSFRLEERVVAPGSDPALAAAAAKCGTEVDWAPSWAEAVARAKRERKLILVIVRFMKGFKITDPTRNTLFMDPDVLALVRHRFVAWRFERGQSPLESRPAYGMGPSALGTSILLVTPGGEVVGDTGLPHPVPFYRFLLDRLAEQPAYPGDADAKDRAGLDLARWRLERGEPAQAWALLKDDATVPGLRLRADYHRRRQAGSDALAALETARQLGAPPETAIDAAPIHLGLGDPSTARTALEAFLKAHPKHARTAEARWWHGYATLATAGKEAAVAIWKPLVAEHPGSRWAWQAAGVMTNTAFSAVKRVGTTAWPAADVLESVRVKTRDALAVTQAAQARADARTFLLRVQRDDGSWIDAGEALRGRAPVPSPFTVAVTAICGQAMLGEAGDEPRAAATRAFTWQQQARRLWKAAPPQTHYMDYTNWSDAMALEFTAGVARAGLAPKAETTGLMNDLVASLVAKQRSNGGWSYFHRTDLDGTGEAPQQSISFVTAAVAQALFAARREGVTAAAKPHARAIRCLEQMRLPDERFAYFLWAGKPASASGGLAGAVGRGPLCEVALLQAGKSTPARVRRALDLFLEHAATFAAEQGKSVMHCGPQAQGSHYLMFDYATASRAVPFVPKAARAPYADALSRLVLSARAADGSYLDNPIKGYHYGAGQGLRALQWLAPSD